MSRLIGNAAIGLVLLSALGLTGCASVQNEAQPSKSAPASPAAQTPVPSPTPSPIETQLFPPLDGNIQVESGIEQGYSLHFEVSVTSLPGYVTSQPAQQLGTTQVSWTGASGTVMVTNTTPSRAFTLDAYDHLALFGLYPSSSAVCVLQSSVKVDTACLAPLGNAILGMGKVTLDAGSVTTVPLGNVSTAPTGGSTGPMTQSVPDNQAAAVSDALKTEATGLVALWVNGEGMTQGANTKACRNEALNTAYTSGTGISSIVVAASSEAALGAVCP
ncbi:hypothetical protein [Microbacterium xylanilyticum]